MSVSLEVEEYATLRAWASAEMAPDWMAHLWDNVALAACTDIAQAWCDPVRRDLQRLLYWPDANIGLVTETTIREGHTSG